MDGVKLFRCFIITVIIVYQNKGSCLMIDELLLCEQSYVDILCPNETVIIEVNISKPKPTLNANFCNISNEDPAYINNNKTSTEQRIGKRSCRILDPDIDFFAQVPDQTWKINIDYTCDNYHDESLYSFKNPRLSVCSDSIGTVGCDHLWKAINIVSVNLQTSESVCRISNDSACADIVANKTKAICNGKQYCDDKGGEALPDIGWNACYNIPKYVDISLLCLATEHVKSGQPEDDNSHYPDKLLGIIVGVTAGIIILVLVSLFLVKRYINYSFIIANTH